MAYVETQNEYKLKNPPEEPISSVKFGSHSNQFLLVSSWDSMVRLYDVNANTLRHKYMHDASVLDACFHDPVHCFSGGLDNVLKMYDFNTTTEQIVGHHIDAIRCIEYCPGVNLIITGSWDSTLKLWDPRSPNCTGTYHTGEKVYTMNLCGEQLVVGTAFRKIVVWDLRNMQPGNPQQKRESSLKYQTRCIRCFPNKQGFVLSSIEGRVAVEYLDMNPEVQKKKYAFKCHRIKENGLENIYPVNAISFHNQYNTFATGGSDGYVNVWDGFNKKRLCQFHRYNTSVTSLSFSPNGNTLAIACSFMNETEEAPTTNPEPTIYIRHTTDNETKPK